ncbi:MAG: sulfotransferase family 2 domain-containing protein [Verrucomicrobiae bacterium]|nr:sulfotransferase family 2 domain-containing protein [Verrucomicrobiae bacterium]
MYSSDLNCLFIHIPKAAGNSIMQSLGTNWENHKDLARYRDELGDETISKLVKFTFVRNPWDRLLSEYNFQRKKHQRADTVRLFLNAPDGSVRTFSEWVEYAFEHPEDHHPKEWGGKTSEDIHRLSPQIDWISLDGEIGVDFVGRIENLQSDFDEVCDRLNHPRQRLRRKNRKFHWHYSRYYNDRTRDLVTDYYRRDIEAFGYRFKK